MLTMLQPDFDKFADGLVPAVVQDARTRKVLMLGYMNAQALEKTITEKTITFFSRSKQQLWTKGETSGNFLKLINATLDCDADALLLTALPVGPTCHTGADTCFNEINVGEGSFLNYLQEVIAKRKNDSPDESYTARMFAKGVNKLAQKVGEEAIELVIEAKDSNDELFKNETADLLFHLLMLLEHRGIDFDQVIAVLRQRHQPKQ